MVQLIRMFILYEDLKLEVSALHVPGTTALDEVSRHYREMYFVRRAFATLWEMDNAIEALQRTRPFKKKMGTLDKRRLQDWKAAVRFFGKAKKFIDRQRNAYGGHVNDELARFILDRVDPKDDSVGALAIRVSDDHTAHHVFKFAESLVSQAFFIDRGDRDHHEYLEESWQVLAEAMRHGAHASQIIADLYLMPVFGWRT